MKQFFSDPKKRKIAIWLTVGVLAIIAAIFGYKWYQKRIEKKKLLEQNADLTPGSSIPNGSKAATTDQAAPSNAVAANTTTAQSREDILALMVAKQWDWTKKNDAFSLKLGSYGQRVKQVQAWLNNIFNAGLVVDGKFGPNTEAALQNAKGVNFVSEKMWNDLGLNAIKA